VHPAPHYFHPKNANLNVKQSQHGTRTLKFPVQYETLAEKNKFFRGLGIGGDSISSFARRLLRQKEEALKFEYIRILRFTRTLQALQPNQNGAIIKKTKCQRKAI
jgi:hypothetical protein